jgi:hypothetical protein
MIGQGGAQAQQGCGSPLQKGKELRLVVADSLDKGLHGWLLDRA